MVVSCDFEFDKNPQGICYTGQEVNGTVYLKVDELQKVDAVTLKVCSFTFTRWTEGSSSSSASYGGLEYYLNTLIYLVGSVESKNCVIEPGTHEYKYKFHVPENCPTSVETVHCKVKFFVRVSLVRPWKFNQNFTRGLTVIHTLDLNEHGARFDQPVIVQRVKKFGFGPMSTDPMTIKVTLARSGFVPGESIPINLYIKNESDIVVKDFKITLFMLVTCYDIDKRSRTRIDRQVVSKTKGQGCLGHCNKVFDYMLEIPATPSTCENVSKLFDLNYELHVEARVKGLYSNHTVNVPVTIGTIPFRESLHLLKAKNKEEESNSSQPNDADGACATLDEYDVPPSYEEAVHLQSECIGDNEKTSSDDTKFAPLYPVFNFSSVPKKDDQLQ